MMADAPLQDPERAMSASPEQSLPTLFAAMVTEISDTAGGESAAAFLSALGERIAGQCDVGGAHQLDTLTERANQLWASLGWGHVTMELHDEGVDIFHHAGPATGDRAFDLVWEQALPALLVGAYGLWFRGLAGPEGLRMRILRCSRDRIDLRYGL